jgi:hypothetical protein
MKPSFKHDCDKCKFVGKVFRALDLYGEKKGLADLYLSCNSTIEICSKYILRCSSKDSDYITTNKLDTWIV